MKTKEQLEADINNSPLFTIDKERDGALYDTEKNKLAGNVWEYCERWLYGDQILEYWNEVHTCLLDCLKPRAFSKDKGKPFLHYFNHSIKLKIHTAKEKQSREEKTTICLTDYMAKRIRNVIQSIELRSTGFDTPEMIERAVNETGYPEKLVKRYIKIYERTRTEESLSDIDTTIEDDHTKHFVDALEDTEQIRKALDIIDQVFLAKQDRVKPYLKRLLTAHKEHKEYFILEVLVKYPELVAKNYSFVDQEILNLYREGKKPPGKKEIAAEFHRDKTDAARTLNGFLKECRKAKEGGVYCTIRKKQENCTVHMLQKSCKYLIP